MVVTHISKPSLSINILSWVCILVFPTVAVQLFLLKVCSSFYLDSRCLITFSFTFPQVRANIVSLASQPLQELYELLEVEFSPLDLCSRVHHITSTLTEDSQYIAPLHEVTLVRLIKQVSQVYQTVKFTRLIELSHFGSPFQLERLLVDCVRHNDMQVRLHLPRKFFIVF